MELCSGAVIVGLGRRYATVAFDRFGSTDQRRLTDVWSPTPWNQLEAGMAYQLHLPMLILKDRAIQAEGILDPAVGDYHVFEFDLAAEAQRLSRPLRDTIAAWGRDVCDA